MFGRIRELGFGSAGEKEVYEQAGEGGAAEHEQAGGGKAAFDKGFDECGGDGGGCGVGCMDGGRRGGGGGCLRLERQEQSQRQDGGQVCELGAGYHLGYLSAITRVAISGGGVEGGGWTAGVGVDTIFAPMKLEIPSHVRGLVFDCDGTIADTMPLHYRAWSQMLREYGHDFPETLFYHFAGVPTVRIIEILNEKHGYKVLPVREAAVRKEALFVELIPQAMPIEPVVELIKEYHGKLPMAVATGGDRMLCTRTLTALSLLEYFQALVTADDVEHGKPAPDIFLEAARRIGVEAECCCAFEDGEMGIRAAKAAGMMVVDVREYL